MLFWVWWSFGLIACKVENNANSAINRVGVVVETELGKKSSFFQDLDNPAEKSLISRLIWQIISFMNKNNLKVYLVDII